MKAFGSLFANKENVVDVIFEKLEEFQPKVVGANPGVDK